MESNLTDHVRGKQVALVGRSQELLKLNQGEIIDAHDVVVRVNNPAPYPIGSDRTDYNREKVHDRTVKGFLRNPVFVPEQYHEFVGSETSVFILNNQKVTNRILADHIEEFCEKLLQAGCEHFVIFQFFKLNEKGLGELRDHCDKIGLHLTIDKDIFGRTKEITGSPPNGGTLAISLLHTLPFTKLYLTGFSKTATNLSKSNQDNGTTHDFRLIKRIVEGDGRIIADPIMQCNFKTIP